MTALSTKRGGHKLGDLLSSDCFQNGIYKHLNSYGDGEPILRINDFDNAGRLLTQEFSRVALSPAEQQQYVLIEGDIVVNRVNSLSHVGKSMLVPSLRKYPVFESNLMRIRIDPASHLVPEYVAAILQGEEARQHFRRVAKPAVAQASINQDDVRAVTIAVHSKPIQRRIAGTLALWDSAIEKTERLIAAKSDQAAQVRERLIGHGTSKHTRLREATRESLARSGSALGRERIMGVTNNRGMRPMREETIAASTDRYKLVRPRAFAYNPMRLNVGSIAMSPFDRDVLVSPDYVVFECVEPKLLPSYLNHLRRTRHWSSFFDVAGSGSVRVRIYYDDLAAFTFPLPSVEEQHRVVAVLDTAAAEIGALTRYADALRRQKRGLMQKLLTDKWRAQTDEGVTA